MSHSYTDTPIHRIPSFHILLSSLLDAWYTVISCSHITVTHACIISIFLSYGSPFILHVLLLHVYSCIPVAWLFLVTDIPVTGYESCWYTMCGIPYLLFLVFCYLVSCYQQSSCPVIVLHVSCTVLVPDTLCTLNVLHITWGWGRHDGWLDLVGWMSRSIVSPTVGDMVVLATFPFPVTFFALAGWPWSQQPGSLGKAVISGMHGIHTPD